MKRLRPMPTCSVGGHDRVTLRVRSPELGGVVAIWRSRPSKYTVRQLAFHPPAVRP